MAIEKELTQQLNELSNLQRGHLVIAGANFFVSYILPPIVRAFTERYPGIDIEISESESNVLYDAALADHIHLILDAGVYDQTLFDSDFLCTENILFAVPSDNPLNQRYRDISFTPEEIIKNRHLSPETSPLPLDAFRDEKLILLHKGHDMHTRSIAICEHAGFTPKRAMCLNQLSTSAKMSAAGLGCCFVTDTLVKTVPLREGALFFYRLDDENAHRDMFIAYPRKMQKNQSNGTIPRRGAFPVPRNT